MSTLRLDPPIWLDTAKGPGLAHIYHSNGIETDSTWTVFICEGEHANEIWELPNHQVRACRNVTAGRDSKKDPKQLEAPENRDWWTDKYKLPKCVSCGAVIEPGHIYHFCNGIKVCSECYKKGDTT